MAENAVEVVFGAETAQLQTGVKQAKAGIDDLMSAIGRAAKQAAGTSVANDNLGKSASQASKGFREMAEGIGDAAYELGPWTGTHVQLAQSAIIGLGAALGAAGVAFAAIGAAAAVAMGVIGAAAIHMGEAAERAHSQFELSGEGVAKLGAVASKSGLELKDVASALQDMSKKARDGDKDIEAAAKALGLTADQLKTKDLPGLLRTLQGAYDKNGDSANRYAAMTKLLGDSFEKLYPAMQEGMGSLDGLYAAADRSGAAIGGPLKDALAGSISASRESGAAWTELKQSVEGAALAMYEHFKPAIDGAIVGFSNLVRNIASAVQGFTEASREASVTSLALDGIAYAARGVITALALLTTAFETLLTTASAVLKEIGDLARGVGNIFKELWKDIAGGDGDMRGAWSKMTGDMTHDAVDWGKNLRAIAKQTKDELATIWGNGKAGKATPPNLRATGNPEPDEEDKKAKAPKGNNDALNAARKDIDGQIEAVKQQTAINKQQYELDAANKKITEDQKKALVKQADDDELASVKALYEQEKQLAGQKPAQIQEINNKIEALEAQHTLKMLQEQTKAAQESAKVWEEASKQMAGTLTSSLSQAIEGAVEHTKTKDAGKKLAQSLFNELTSDLVKQALTNPLETALAPMFKGLASLVTQPLQQGLQAVIQPISSTITGALGGAAGGATEAAGGAALTGAATALTTAAAALSSAAAALGAGGAAAGAGGAAAGAGGAAAGGGGFLSSLFGLLPLPPFAEGSWELPALGNFDGKGGFPALVHPGEMIVPSGQAGPLRQALKGGGVGAGAGGGGNTVHVAPTFNISATDSQDVHRMFMANQRQFGKAVSKMMRNGVMLGK